MKLPIGIALLCSVLLLGCYSTPNLIGGGGAQLIKNSKNFTMKEGWQDSFKLSENSTNVYTLTVSSVASKAAMLKIGAKPILLHLGDKDTVSLDGNNVTITLNDISDGYAKFTISVSSAAAAQQQGGQQNNTPQGGQTQNGAACSNNSVCQSTHCSNGYCCASGSCCISDLNCSIGKCNMTTYSCFSPTLLSNASPCTTSADCQSGHCSNGYCCASGKCCISTSNCASGEMCNTTTYSCAQAAPAYTATDAELIANSTVAGALMGRFASIFRTARNCPGGSSAYEQCVPVITTREDKVSPSTFRVIYSYSFSGTGCCANADMLVITAELTTNATTTQWIDTTITSSLADSMESSLSSNCVSALQLITCKIS